MASKKILPKSKDTLERVDPSKSEQKFLYQEHLIRYLFASQYTKNKIVLDAACGNGYGSSLLLEKGAQKVIGIDISESTIDFCKKKYSSINLDFNVSDCSSMSFQNSTFDSVVSFETIEHLERPEQAICEFKRILTSNGYLIISTPNIENYDEENPYHEHEFSLSEFQSILKNFFKNVEILYQFYPSSMMIGNYDKTTSFETIITDDKINDETQPLYFIAICSDSTLPLISNNNFIFKDSNLITGKKSHLKELQEQNTANESHLEELQELNTANESHLEELRSELARRLKSYEDELQKVQNENRDELQKVHNSFAWKILRNIDKLVGKNR